MENREVLESCQAHNSLDESRQLEEQLSYEYWWQQQQQQQLRQQQQQLLGLVVEQHKDQFDQRQREGDQMKQLKERRAVQQKYEQQQQKQQQQQQQLLAQQQVQQQNQQHSHRHHLSGQHTNKLSSHEDCESWADISDDNVKTDRDYLSTLVNDKLTDLLENLEFEYGLMEKLIENGILDTEKRSYAMTDQIPRYERCRRLIEFITKESFNGFIECLRSTKQNHLAAFLHDKAVFSGARTEDDVLLDREVKVSCIVRNLERLVSEISCGDVLDKLYARGCINDYHRQSIESKGLRKDKNTELLYIMLRRSQGDFIRFKEILLENPQHLSSLFY